MRDLVKNNPFRILGVYADASIKEITSNKTKLLAYAKVNKQLEFNSDCTSLLGAVDRTVASVTEAERELTLPENKIKYALFWFINDGPINSVALSNIQEGSSYNVIKAMDILLKKPSFGSWINLATLSLIQGDVENVINCILRFLTNKSYCLQFSTAICGDSFKIAPEKLWDLYTDKLQESVSWYRILQHVKESEHESFCKQFEDKCVETVVSQIQDEISFYKPNKDASAEELYFAGMRLHEETRSLVALIKAELDTSDVRIKSILDKLADAILQNSIYFYRASKDEFAAYKALELQMYAEGIAVGEMTKSRCKHNYETLTKIIKRLPSKQVRKEWASIHKFADEAKDCITALRFLKKCSDILVCAKEKYGKNNDDYVKLSTEVANIALNKVIDDINTLLADLKDPFKEFVAISSIQSALPRAWEVIKSIESLDLSKEFVEDRLQNNKKTLSDMMSKLNVYVGHIHSCIDIRTDDEVFESCKTIGDYEDYCKRFPQGKHHKEAQDKIREHMEQDKKRKRNTWMWVFIIVAAILGTIIWALITADDRAYANTPNTKEGLSQYINQWYPDGKHLDEAYNRLYHIYAKEGVKSLDQFSRKYSYHYSGKQAKKRVTEICDSLYAIAKKKHTIKGWDEYAVAVPSGEIRDCSAKKEEIRKELELKKWKNDSSAWSEASKYNTIPMYEKYLKFHPYGTYASRARKRIIDIKVEDIFAGDHGTLPEMDKSYYGGGPTSTITVKNDTGYKLTLLYSSDNQSREIVIGVGGERTFSLNNGYYKVAASVNAYKVSNYVGREYLNGGGYEVTYYIVTHRF